MKLKTILTTALVAAAISTQVQAQEWKKTLTPSNPKGGAALKPVHLTYEANFNGAIKSGKISFIFDKKDKRYPKYFISQCYGGSSFNSLPYKLQMTSFASRKTLLPKLMVSKDKDKRKEESITNKFYTSSVSHKKTTKNFVTGTTDSSQSFKASAIHDPLTAMMFIRSQKLEVGNKINIFIFPSTKPYLVNIDVLSKEIRHGKPCFKLNVIMRRVNKDTGKLEPYKKLKKANIWITADDQRIPLEFRIEVNLAKYIKLGSVRLILKAQQKP